MLLHLHLIIMQWNHMKHQTMLQPAIFFCVVVVVVEIPAERRCLLGFIWRKNNVRNALTCQWRWYLSIMAAVLPRLPPFG